MIQRPVIVLLLLMMVVWVGCGEDEPEKVKPKVVDEVADEGPMKRIIWEADGAKMALIPAGSFEMGDSKDEPEAWMKRSLPVHTVELDAFYMDVNEVTMSQFKQFVEESGYAYEGNWNEVAKYSPTDEHPMIWVTWDNATAYAQWVGKRLPTEAEWEYAARGGLTGKRYPWGDELTHDDANYEGTGGRDQWEGPPNGGTAPVGSFEPNGYGLYDIAGNAWEWCADWYGANYYTNFPVKNPKGPNTGQYRVLRGGSWHYRSNYLRVAYRNYDLPSDRYSSLGFRCVSGFPTVEQ